MGEADTRSFVPDLQYSVVFVATSKIFYLVRPMGITLQDLTLLEYMSNMYRFTCKYGKDIIVSSKYTHREYIRVFNTYLMLSAIVH
jgi:hypothetical protein